MKLIFKGIVQGVGFRPTIYRVAKKLGLKGYVLNKGSEVEVVINRDVENFIKELKTELPSIAKINSIEKLKDESSFSDFKILHSKSGTKHSQIPADVGICNSCLAELFDRNDKRYFFPFTNCTVCGARYSLIKDVPYDRERTSMQDFLLCKSCKAEYTDPLNKRYHAQTISCQTCGPHYRLYDKNKKDLGQKDAIKRFAKEIDSGKIGVIKSWGGMHLCCSIDEIPRFRKWYKRPQKAFALMVKDLKTAKCFAEISKDEEEFILSKSRPIILVKKKKCEIASPGLDSIGLFLPYTGLHHLLFEFVKSDALVMTSANVPGEAMITTDEEAFSIDADFYLLHNRKIPNRVDDSVIRLWKNNSFFLRKSRGFVPDPLKVDYDSHILSVGAGENITGAFSSDKQIFATQYIGNSKYYSTLEFLENALRHLMKLTMIKPGIDAVVADLHPSYDTKKVANKFATEFSVPLFEVQHHWAHAASLMVDRGLDACVTLCLDGLGYGSDGNFWGGEVITSNFNEFNRVGHLEYIPLIGGDAATNDPRRLVYAIMKNFDKQMYFTGNESEIFDKLLSKSPKSSSLGRILDAISCYLGICQKRTYDGEPAMKLEKYLAAGKPKYKFDCEIENNTVKTINLFGQLDDYTKKGISESKKADLAYSMVKSIIDSLTDIAIDNARAENIKSIGLSGGVTYNLPINIMVYEKLRKTKFDLVVHNSVCNGDGGISIGQNAIIGHKLKT
jgi:hydrogenase maturation protein HypF